MTETWIQPTLFDTPEGRTPLRLQTWLERELGRPVDLVLTRNRVSMLTVRMNGTHLHLRMHEHFLTAPDTVWHALRTYLRSRRRSAWAVVQRFAEEIPPSPRTAARTPVRRTRGRVHDLACLYREVNETFFDGRISCGITWGRRAASRKRGRARCIQYGSYSAAQALIRIHPRLDDPRVPVDFVRYIVFHEMLHADVPPVRRNGRLYHHSAEFRRRERRYPAWTDMQSLSRQLLHELG